MTTKLELKPKKSKLVCFPNTARVCHHCRFKSRWISRLGGGIVESFCTQCNTKFIDISVPKNKVAGLCIIDGADKIYRLSIKEVK